MFLVDQLKILTAIPDDPIAKTIFFSRLTFAYKKFIGNVFHNKK